MRQIFKMNKPLSILLFFFISPLILFSQGVTKKFKDVESWKYEIEGVQQGVSGVYVLKVWLFSKRPKIDMNLAKKSAIHGVIFRGYSGQLRGLMAQPPLTNNPNLEQEKEEFFDDFFADGGKYLKYIDSRGGDPEVGPGDRIKEDQYYKVGVIIPVRVAELRKDLENAKIIRSLLNGFE